MNTKQIVFGTGPLGLAIMDELVNQDKSVTLINRSGQVNEQLPQGVKVVSCDATNPDAVAEVCKNADTVFHCAMPPYNKWPELFPALTKGILEGVTRADARLVYGDNLYMYGPTDGKPIHEGLPYAATNRKGSTRAQMAKSLLDAHRSGKVDVVIGRGSDFYGPRVTNSTLGADFFNGAAAGKTVNLLGEPSHPHSYTYIGDFAKALVLLSQRDDAYGEAWHVPNAPTRSTNDFVKLVENEIGQSIKVRTSGSFMVSLLGLFVPMVGEMKEMMYEFQEPFVVDSSKFTEAFSMRATPLTDGIRETVAWYRSQNQKNSSQVIDSPNQIEANVRVKS